MVRLTIKQKNDKYEVSRLIKDNNSGETYRSGDDRLVKTIAFCGPLLADKCMREGKLTQVLPIKFLCEISDELKYMHNRQLYRNNITPGIHRHRICMVYEYDDIGRQSLL